jgi:sulfide:quinone oxidoreductase
MNKRIVILGAGTGGTLVANRLRRVHDEDEVEIVVVDQDDDHVYQPGLLFVPFGFVDPADIVRPRHRQLHDGIRFRPAGIDHVDLEADRVHLADGTVLGYDVLIVATGARLLPEETQGLTGQGWGEKVFTFYDLDGALALREAIARFKGGRIVVDVLGMPIKAPVAPLEFCFLSDWYFQRRGIRRRVDLAYVTPLLGAYPEPVAAEALTELLNDKDVQLVTGFDTRSVRAGGSGDLAGRLVSSNGREVEFDMAVVVPLHGGAAYVGRSPGLGDALGFVPVDEHTLQSRARPNVFAIGDAAGVPTSKQGSVTHFESDVLVENVRRFLAGRPLDASYDGHTSHLIETGFNKALLIDFNYDRGPSGGHFPAKPGLPLLKESRLNHLSKIMFPLFYWHGLLHGRDIPGIGSAMPGRGKARQPQ